MAVLTDQLNPQPFKRPAPTPGPAGIMGPGVGGSNTHLRIRAISNKSKQRGQQLRMNAMNMMAPGGPQKLAGALLLKHRGLINRFIDRVIAED